MPASDFTVHVGSVSEISSHASRTAGSNSLRTSVLFPLPLTPVTATRRPVGTSSVTLLRLCRVAPVTIRRGAFATSRRGALSCL